MAHTDYAYMQARLQARHGSLPTASLWQALDASRTTGRYLSLARSGPLATWVEGIDEAPDVHQVERSLRARWRRYVDEVAGWQPPPWRAVTGWFGTLIELPLIDAQRRTEAATRWHGDERLAAFSQPDRVARRASLQSSGLVPFANVTSPVATAQGSGPGAASVSAIWLDEWQRLCPGGAEASLASRRPAELLMPRLLGASPGRGAGSEPVRLALSRLFRRNALSPVAAFAHLALVAMNMERLRGGIIVRRSFERGRVEGDA